MGHSKYHAYYRVAYEEYCSEDEAMTMGTVEKL
jgi:hypothetical protein